VEVTRDAREVSIGGARLDQKPKLPAERSVASPVWRLVKHRERSAKTVCDVVFPGNILRLGIGGYVVVLGQALVEGETRVETRGVATCTASLRCVLCRRIL
jgi:hypothetical protein